LSTAEKKAALRLTYLPTTKKLDSLHPTQDANATAPTAIQSPGPDVWSRYGRWNWGFVVVHVKAIIVEREDVVVFAWSFGAPRQGTVETFAATLETLQKII